MKCDDSRNALVFDNEFVDCFHLCYELQTAGELGMEKCFENIRHLIDVLNFNHKCEHVILCGPHQDIFQMHFWNFLVPINTVNTGRSDFRQVAFLIENIKRILH